MSLIYMDYAATAPIRPEVLEAVLGVGFGNPSSAYSIGRASKAALEEAREVIAHALGAKSREVSFTSGGTEANNWAMLSAARSRRHIGNHIITSRIEHHSVLYPCQQLEKEGFSVTYLGVNKEGFIDVRELEEALTDNTILVSIMLANNEVGTIMPIQKVSELTRPRSVLLHTDAVQAFGRIPTDVASLGVDMLTISGHKLGAPKGVGALYVSADTKIPSLLFGGAQERGRRAGTENVSGIVGLGIAATLAAKEMPQESPRLASLREELYASIVAQSPTPIHRNSPAQDCLPHILNISIEGTESELLLMMLDGHGVCASAGAACASGALQASHVLSAMDLPDQRKISSLRLSIGHSTTHAHIHSASHIISSVQNANPD